MGGLEANGNDGDGGDACLNNMYFLKFNLATCLHDFVDVRLRAGTGTTDFARICGRRHIFLSPVPKVSSDLHHEC